MRSAWFPNSDLIFCWQDLSSPRYASHDIQDHRRAMLSGDDRYSYSPARSERVVTRHHTSSSSRRWDVRNVEHNGSPHALVL